MNALMRSTIVLGLVAACVLGAGMVLAGVQELAGREPLVDVNVTATKVHFQVKAPNDGFTLTIVDPLGEVETIKAKAGQPASFGLYDGAGELRPFGSYTWELRIDPIVSAQIKQKLADARKRGEEKAVIAQLRKTAQLPAGDFSQSGALLLTSEGFVSPSLIEKDGASSADNARAARELGLSTGMLDGSTARTTQINLPLDQVIADDLIVTGSICAGFDCVNNESFGFDTIRLKENNLRIKFDDTSATAGFPAMDWQLTANDSASGGLNKFSIEDITDSKVPFTIVGNAATNSIYVDGTGRVGFRTSTPVLDLHVRTSNTPALRLEQDSSGGFTAQTWDIAGNEANFFVRDVTGGSRLPLRIRPGAPTSSIDINASGFVGIATSSPSSQLHVNATTAGDGGTSNGTGSAVYIKQNTAWTSLQPWALFVDGYSNFGGIRIRGTDGQRGIHKTTAGGILGFSAQGDDPITFTQSATLERMRIAAGGNVGIGTTTPAGKLDVNGTIYQRGGLLHADYVFSPDYQLESIEEHQRQAWENKRLPAMPGRTVDEQGREVVELGGHQRGIVEELEKAHIYIEQLNDKLKAMEEADRDKATRLAELERRLQALIAQYAGAAQPPKTE